MNRFVLFFHPLHNQPIDTQLSPKHFATLYSLIVIVLDFFLCCSMPDNLNFSPFVPAYNYLFAIIAY